MPRNLLWLALLLGVAACSRSYQAPTHLSVGSVCSSNGACGSGVCADGVCCAKSCAADETCNAPGHAGACTARQLGDACSAGAQCPSSFCADGVCCESACDQPCETCSGGLNPGLCRLADDNTDPRGDCPGPCNTCYSGVCGLAVAGTNTKASAGCAVGQACGEGGSCEVANGFACTDDSQCALRHCVSGTCISVTVETVPVQTEAAATEVEFGVTSVATTSSRDDALTFLDYETETDSDGNLYLLRSRATLVFRRPGKAWTSSNVTTVSAAYGDYAEVVFLGRTPYVVRWLAPDESGNCGAGLCALVGNVVYEDGTLGPDEPIASNVTLDNSNDAMRFSVRLDTAGDVIVGWSDVSGLHTSMRPEQGEGSWTSLGSIPRPSDFALGGAAFGSYRGQPAYVTGIANPQDAFDGTAVGLEIRGPDGTVLKQLSGGDFPCGDASFITLASPSGIPSGDDLSFTLVCDPTGTGTGAVLTLHSDGTLTSIPLQGSSSDFVSGAQYLEDPATPWFVESSFDINSGSSTVAVGPADGSSAPTRLMQNSGEAHDVAAVRLRDGQMLMGAALDANDPGTGASLGSTLYVARLAP